MSNQKYPSTLKALLYNYIDYCIIWIVSPGAYFQKGGRLFTLLFHSHDYLIDIQLPYHV